MSRLRAPSTIDTDARNLEPKCAACELSAWERQGLAVEVLSEARSIRALSRQHQVSRKFVAQQRDKAADALEEAFDPWGADSQVLFYRPVNEDPPRQTARYFIGFT